MTDILTKWRSGVPELHKQRFWNEYRKERELWPAQQAFRNARTRIRWRDMGGVVIHDSCGLPDEAAATWRPFVEEHVDEAPYDMSYIDTWGLTEGRVEKLKERLSDRIHDEGVWSYFSGYMIEDGEKMEIVDTIYGFIGEDFFGSGYDIDLMNAAMDACQDAQSAAVHERVRERMNG